MAFSVAPLGTGASGFLEKKRRWGFKDFPNRRQAYKLWIRFIVQYCLLLINLPALRVSRTLRYCAPARCLWLPLLLLQHSASQCHGDRDATWTGWRAWRWVPPASSAHWGTDGKVRNGKTNGSSGNPEAERSLRTAKKQRPSGSVVGRGAELWGGGQHGQSRLLMSTGCFHLVFVLGLFSREQV